MADPALLELTQVGCRNDAVTILDDINWRIDRTTLRRRCLKNHLDQRSLLADRQVRGWP